MFASAMSSSRIGPCPHHSDSRWPSTSRSSPRRSRYSNKRRRRGRADRRRAPAGAAAAARVAHRPALRAAPCRTADADTACRCPDRRTAPRSLRARRGDRRARHDPDAHRFAAARVDVARVLQRDARRPARARSRVLVRRAVLRLREHFPQRPLRRSGLVGGRRRSVPSPASGRRRRRCGGAASRRTPPPPRAPTRPRRAPRAAPARRSRLHGPLPLITCQNSSQSISPNSQCSVSAL